MLLQGIGGGVFQNVAVEQGVDAYGYTDDSEAYGEYLPLDPKSKNPQERAFALWAEDYLHEDREYTHVAVGWAALWLDYDHDGALDLYVCNGYLGGSPAPVGPRLRVTCKRSMRHLQRDPSRARPLSL